MSFSFYCTGCGKRLEHADAKAEAPHPRKRSVSLPVNTAGEVLYDLQYLLTGKDEDDEANRFSVLKLRLTESELQTLTQGQKDSEGYVRSEVRLQDVTAYISNGNNLNNERIRGLKWEDICTFILEQNKENVQAQKKDRKASTGKSKKRSLFGDDEDDSDTTEEPGTGGEANNEAEKTAVMPDAIQALIDISSVNMAVESVKRQLATDLGSLQTAFGSNGNECPLRFDIKEIRESAADGSSILTGYRFKRQDSQQTVSIEKARLCPRCGEQIFRHAGTARHQAISFIGYQSSGKTSTILALTSYLENQSQIGTNLDDKKIWTNAKAVPHGASFELLERPAALKADLENYSQGIAPDKTKVDERKNAYSATFRIKNEANKYSLLTLTDLPGELCYSDGTIDNDRIMNTFPVALNCDAYIACFDTKDTLAHSERINTVCMWTQAFQDLRAEAQSEEAFVPTMLLFCKCAELEAESAAKAKAPVGGTPIEKVYKLRPELVSIKTNPALRVVFDTFARFGKLNSGYHASLRCSPYGYDAPQASAKNATNAHPPTPKNIDLLMEWILCVTGCIPADPKYQVPGSTKVTIGRYCLERPQIRLQAPIESNLFQEAIVRCALFDNPGKLDKMVVSGNFGYFTRRRAERYVRNHPNGNAE